MTKKSRTLIALTSVLVLTLLPFLSPQCKKTRSPGQIDEVDVSALVLFKVGDVKLNDKQIAVGDIVKGGFEIKVGAQSLCDLQIKEPNLTITLRIKADTVVVLSARSRGLSTVLRPTVRIGGLMIRTSKLQPGEAVEVISQTAMASVRGTDFEMNVTPKGTEITVARGKVAVRPRIPGLEDLPAGVVAGSESLRKVLAGLNKQEAVLGSGKSLAVDGEYTNRIVKAVPGLQKLLESPALKAVAGKTKADPAAIAAAVKALETGLKTGGLAEKITGAADKDARENPAKPVQLKGPELQKKLKEYDELIAMEQSKLRSAKDYKKAVAEFNKKRRPALLKKIGEIMDRDPITLNLKDGRKISGVQLPAGNENAPYVVLTPEGRKTVRKDQVASISY